jgi:hypothetical protein
VSCESRVAEEQGPGLRPIIASSALSRVHGVTRRLLECAFMRSRARGTAKQSTVSNRGFRPEAWLPRSPFRNFEEERQQEEERRLGVWCNGPDFFLTLHPRLEALRARRRDEQGEPLGWLHAKPKERQAAINALGGVRLLHKAVDRLWERARLRLVDIWSAYLHAESLEAKVDDHRDFTKLAKLRQEQTLRTKKAIRCLKDLDGLDIPRSRLEPLESFLVEQEILLGLNYAYSGRGRGLTATAALRGYLKYCRLGVGEIARVELGWLPPMSAAASRPPTGTDFDRLKDKVKRAPKPDAHLLGMFERITGARIPTSTSLD